jgi:hypothetical protein
VASISAAMRASRSFSLRSFSLPASRPLAGLPLGATWLPRRLSASSLASAPTFDGERDGVGEEGISFEGDRDGVGDDGTDGAGLRLVMCDWVDCLRWWLFR